MEIIKNNPYRTIGVLANATEKEIQRQRAKINAYVSVGKAVHFDTDFDFLDLPNRDESSINAAFSSIQLNQSKVTNSLFWFINGSHLDEPAFNYLKDKDTFKAIDIWTRTSSGEVTVRNFSSYNNIGTLKLALAFSNGTLDKTSLAEGIWCKLRLIESDGFKEFARKVADETFAADSAEQAKLFVDQLLTQLSPYIGTPSGISIIELLTAFADTSKEVKQYLSQKFTEPIITNVEGKIGNSKNHRKENPLHGYRIGVKLYNDTKEDIAQLKTLLASGSMQYQIVADKLAQEIMQCGIDYFQKYQESDHLDPSNDAMKLMRAAKAIAVGTQAKQRIDENISGLQDWINDKPDREKQKKIVNDLEYLAKSIEGLQKIRIGSVESARAFVMSCKPKLVNIKSVLGAHDEYYLMMSSAIVSHAQGMLVSVVNSSQEKATLYGSLSPTGIVEVSKVVREANDVMELLVEMDMVSELRVKFSQNKQALINIKNQINSALSKAASSSSKSSSSSGGCYIATMAYGDYEHPQVLALRSFRDNVLAKYKLGTWFIHTYYRISPTLVVKLKNKQGINSSIRFVLNQIIKIIK